MQGGIFLLIHPPNERICWDSKRCARHENGQQQVKQTRTLCPHGAFILMRGVAGDKQREVC